MNKKQQPFFNPELSGLCSQMAMILHSGISPLEGITIMLEDSTSEQEKEIVTDCIHKIQIELEHAIERAVILSTGTMLTPDDFMLRSPRSSNTVSEKDKYNLERMEKDAINEVMRMCGGNITLAAEMLGITRTSLYRRIEKFRL